MAHRYAEAGKYLWVAAALALVAAVAWVIDGFESVFVLTAFIAATLSLAAGSAARQWWRTRSTDHPLG
jgi:hypothetical protein